MIFSIIIKFINEIVFYLHGIVVFFVESHAGLKKGRNLFNLICD